MSRAVIFDCDGVLVDSEVLAVEIELSCLAEIGLTYERHDYLHRFLGTGGDEFYAGIGQDYRAKFGKELPDTLHTRIHERYRAEIDHVVEAIPGTHDVAAAITTPKAVASSSSIVGLERKLKKVGLFDAFAPHVYSAQLVARAKPAPDLFLFTAQKLEIDPAQCIVIEDSANGVLAAKAAGMTVLGFIGGGHCLPTQADKLRAAGAVSVMTHMNQLMPTLAEIS